MKEYLPLEAARAARDDADIPVLVLDAPPPEAAELVKALVAAGTFAHLDSKHLIVAVRRSLLAALVRHADPAVRTIAAELLRALDADRKRSAELRMRRYRLDLRPRARVMAILNVTPDSFYEEGRYRSLDRARARAHELVALGADLIDIGGQSYAHWNMPVAQEEERERVVPIVEALVRDDLGVPLSIDTFKTAVAEAALAAGADLINDCSGLADERLASTVARYDAALVVMHLKGELNLRATDYPYEDALAEVLAFLRERLDRALAAGVARDSLVVDPGLEFGKEPTTDLEILARFGDLRSLGYPILFAASRKSFIGRIFNRPARDLLVPSLATAAVGITAGARLVRVHDVAETLQLATMLGALEHRNQIAVAPAMPETRAARDSGKPR